MESRDARKGDRNILKLRRLVSVLREDVLSTPTASRYSRADACLYKAERNDLRLQKLSGSFTSCGGRYYITMNKITKDISEEENGQMPVVSKQDGAKVDLAKSNALVAYEEQEAAPQKKGFFGNSKRRMTPSLEQFRQLFLENIETFPDYEARLLRAIFDLRALTAQEVMMPLSEIVPLTAGSPCSEVPKLCRASNYRYIPIYNERVDWLLGVVDAMEILTSEQHDDDLSPFVKDAYYVPALKPAIDLLNELRQAEIPAAIVVNEHGSCIGIVELVDILEKIVGEITANRKRDTPRIEELGRGEWRIDARVLIPEVNMALDTQIPTDRCDTMGGFILMLLGRLPQEGEKVEYENLEFNIDEVLKYRISGIRVIKKTVRKTKR